MSAWFAGPWAAVLTWTLLHFLWQGALLAGGMQALLAITRCRSADARYAAWLLTLVLMAAAPACTALVLDGATPASAPVADEENVVPVVAAADLADFPLGSPSRFSRTLTVLQPYILAGWLLGVALGCVRLLLGAAWVAAVARSVTALPIELEQTAARLARRLGFRRPPRVAVSDAVSEPLAMQLIRPLVLLPASWLVDAPPALLEAVLAHELAHLRRYDLWVNWLQRVVETLLFFHPAVWWVSQQIRLERELCCDALAVTAIGRAVDYARALEAVAVRRLARVQPVWVMGLGGTRMALLHRIKRVLGLETAAADSGWWSLGLTGLGVSTACCLGALLWAPTVQGDEDAAAPVSADQVAQRGDDRPPPREGERRPDGPPRDGERRPDGPPREGERRPEGRPRDGERRPDGPPRDGERRPDGPPRDGERGPRGPRPEGERGPDGRGPRPDGEFRGPPPPNEMLFDLMHAVRELRQEVQMLREELHELRAQRRPGPRDGDRLEEPGRRGPRPEGRDGERGPEPPGPPRGEFRDGPPRGPDGRPGPRPEGRDGERPGRPEAGPRPPRGPEDGRRPEGDRPRRPEGERPDRERPDRERPDAERPGPDGPRPDAPAK